MRACAHRKCRRPATQAFDVGSWFSTKQNTVHYEVCDEHAAYFARPFDRQQSERVEKDMEPWTALVPGEAGR
jgi:hypothetical protein